MIKNFFFIPYLVIITLLLIVSGCQRFKEVDYYSRPGKVVAISLFKCDCELLEREAIQDTFIDVFYKLTDAKPIKGNTGDINIVGIITIGTGQTGHSPRSASSGKYISGITLQAYKDGKIIATHSVGQDLGRGVLFSPVSLAKQAAQYISTVLVRQNEIGR